MTVPREDGLITARESGNLWNWQTYATRSGEGPWTRAPHAAVIADGVLRTTFAPPLGSETRCYRVRFSLLP